MIEEEKKKKERAGGWSGGREGREGVVKDKEREILKFSRD